MRRLAIIAVFAGFLAVGTASPVAACSYAEPPSVQDLVSGSFRSRNVAGVYEQQHIDSRPNLILWDVRTVSVVTRYWGEPPLNTGLVMHGDSSILGSDSCGNESGDEGMVGYGWVESAEDGERRFLPWVTLDEPGTWRTTGRVSADQEALLTAAFGPPVVLDVSPTTRVLAFVQLWWLPTLIGIALGSILYVVSRRHISREISTTGRFDRWVPAAAGFFVLSVLGLATAAPPERTNIWPLLAFGLAAAVVTWLSRTIGAWFALVAVYVGLEQVWSEAGDFPFRNGEGAIIRAEAAVALAAVGLGVLMWIGRHWGRWPASLAVISGATIGGSALWPLLDRVSWVLIGGTTFAAAVAAAAFVLWRAAAFPRHRVDVAGSDETGTRGQWDRLGTWWPSLTFLSASPGGGRGRPRSVEESPDSTGHGAG